MRSAVVLTAHGTVESLDDLGAFITKIRHGNAPPKSVVDEVRRRYEAIGGVSPLAEATRELARKVEARLGVPVRIAMRLWNPLPSEVVPALANEGVERLAVVALAQFSAAVYRDAIVAAAKDVAAKGGPALDVRSASNWGTHPGLVAAQAKRVQNAIDALPPEARKNSRIVFTAHSLPKIVIDRGDPYEKDFRASVDAIARALGPTAPPHLVAFQSQGMTGPGETQTAWLRPDLETTLDAVRTSGVTHVVFAPVGFLADHVEILYDLDIEAKALAAARGITTSRASSLNADDDFADAVAALARPLLDG